MRPVLSPSEAAALDQGAEARGISVDSLMERAGEAVARAAVDLAGGVYGRRVVVVCGGGNNGGDGLVAARYLDAFGLRVTVLLLSEPSGGSSASNLARLAETHVRVRALSEFERELERADVVVDAMFGTGFHGLLEGEAAAIVEALNASEVPVVAADISSGVDGATGAVPGTAVLADLTVAFGAVKTGTVLFPGADFAGMLDVAEIGFPDGLVSSDVGLTESSDVEDLLPSRMTDTNKRATGVALIVGGSRTMTGAVCLAAESAYRAGAGLVTVAVPEGILATVEAAVTEATFIALPETDEGSIGADSFKVLWDHLGDFDAFAVGPGLGRNEETAEFVRAFAAAVPKSLVIDADGLNAFKGGKAGELTDRGATEVVLTPHAGEFARLSGQSVEEIEADRLAAVRGLVAATQATVLLKGSRTVIGDGGTPRIAINPTGSPALATAGAGDVLTGTIAAMLARGLSGFDAATVGAFVHGLAGLIAGEELGDGTTAGNVSALLPRAIREVGG